MARQKLPRALMKRHVRSPLSPLSAVDILRRKMHHYDKNHPTIVEFILNIIRSGDKSRFDVVKQYESILRKCDDIVIDCAHKLAPYESPKLESIEVKNRIEHRFVIRTPQVMKNTSEWMAATGAESLTEDQVKKAALTQQKSTTPVPSIHDFSEDDDYTEPGMIN